MRSLSPVSCDLGGMSMTVVLPIKASQDARKVFEGILQRNLYQQAGSQFEAKSALNSTRLCNVGVIGHVDHGKTTIMEWLLRQCGADISHKRAMDSISRESGDNVSFNTLLVVFCKNGEGFNRLQLFQQMLREVISLRTVRRDLMRYEELDKEVQAQMNEGRLQWMLVIGDSMQIFGIVMVMILFAALGSIPLAPRGVLITEVIFFYLVLGITASYVAVRLWKTLNCGNPVAWALASWCMCKGVVMLQKGVVMPVDFLVLPMGGCQEVLEAQWMRELDDAYVWASVPKACRLHSNYEIWKKAKMELPSTSQPTIKLPFISADSREIPWPVQIGNAIPVGGLAHYITAPSSLANMAANLFHALFYIVFMLSACASLSKTWTEGSGSSSARDVAKILKEQQMMMSGHRESNWQKELNRCSYTSTTAIVPAITTAATMTSTTQALTTSAFSGFAFISTCALTTTTPTSLACLYLFDAENKVVSHVLLLKTDGFHIGKMESNGLLVIERARKYAIVKELDEPVILKEGTIVLQFETRLQNGAVSVDKVLPVDNEVIAEWKSAGASWFQFDEPTLVWDLDSNKLVAFTKAYTAWELSFSGLNGFIVSYLADVPAESYKTNTILSGISGFGLGCVSGAKIVILIKRVKPRGLG